MDNYLSSTEQDEQPSRTKAIAPFEMAQFDDEEFVPFEMAQIPNVLFAS